MGHSIDITVGGQSASARLPLAGPHTPCASLYLHVPFCFHKCHYCDFYSLVDTHDRVPTFVDHLIRELRFLAPHAARLDTIFVGGGTPTLLPPQQWGRILHALHDLFEFGPGSGHHPDTEFTVECNPETATPDLMARLADGGVNRISIGAQSFNPAHLRTLERWHEPGSVRRALDLARDAGIRRRSIDLIFAIPAQTLDDWKRDLDTALTLPVEHVSAYALTYEPNTPMTIRLTRGDFEPTDEDTEAAMFTHTADTLHDAGFQRYEISNFARGPDARSRHNLAYWRHHDWLAAGPSASAHVAGHRWKNVPRIDEWIRGIDRFDGASPILDHEPPDPRRDLAERIMMGLRLAEGLDEPDLLARAEPLGAAPPLAARIEHQIDRHTLERAADRIRLTRDGFLVADAVAAHLMGAIDRPA